MPRNIDENSQEFAKLKEMMMKGVELNSYANTLDIIQYIVDNYTDNEDPTTTAAFLNEGFLMAAKKVDMNMLKKIKAFEGIETELKSLGDYISIANDISTGSKFISSGNDMDKCMKLRDEIKILEEERKTANPDRIKKIDDKVYELRQQSNKLLKNSGVQLINGVSSIVAKIPGFGLSYSIIFSKTAEVFEQTFDRIENYYNTIDAYIKMANGENVSELDLKSSLKNYPGMSDVYNDLMALKASGILDLDPSKKTYFDKKIKEAEYNWMKTQEKIGVLNRTLIDIGDHKRRKETVETVFKYTPEKGLEKVREGKNKANQSYDPLVVDLENNGFDMIGIKDGVHFDLDGDGLKEKTSWIDKKDGILVIDLDENGKIETGSELFGDNFLLENGTYANSAIQALSSLDKNKDNVIDSKDDAYSKLMIWRDINGNGVTDLGELDSLSSYNISSINLSDIQESSTTINGSKLKRNISYEIEEKIIENNEEKIIRKKGKIGEFLLEKDSIDTIDEDIISKISKEDMVDINIINRIKSLPNIRSFGKVRTLHNEMLLDKSGKLVDLVEKFSKSSDINEKDNLLDKILIKLGKAQNTPETERGHNINGQYVKVLEEFFGESLEKGELNQRRADFYKNAYGDLKLLYFSILTINTTFKDINSFFDIKESKLINIDLFNKYILLNMTNDSKVSGNIFDSASRVLMYLDSVGIQGFEKFKEYFSSMSSEYLDKIAKANIKLYNGTKNSETMYSYSKGVTILAGDGNDTINGIFNGISGNDYFYGEKGNDTINGGLGSDVYFFNLGDGQDTIVESANENDKNIIAFGKGITKENLVIKRINMTDIEISIKDTDDKITIKNQIGNISVINKIYFHNGDSLSDIQIREIISRITQGDDYIEGTANDDNINLLSGDDTIYAKSGNDTIYGQEGNDTIFAEEGNDILVGGLGNDKLNGSYGNDTYIFNLGDGQDIIEDYDSNVNMDKIKFGDNIIPENISLKRINDDLEISIKNSSDKILIKNQFSSKQNTIESVEFTNGNSIDFQTMLDMTNIQLQTEKAIKGAYNNDILQGESIDEQINGYYGEDTLIGNKGNDILDGGYDNDTYIFNIGDGQDTIRDSSGYDKIIFGDGITKDNIIIAQINSSDIVVKLKDSDDSITMQGQVHGSAIDIIEFSDGSKLTYNEIKELSNKPTEFNDYIQGSSNNDEIYGEGGDDKIYASYGDDVLVGGKGNDYLQGYYGADTYIFSRGDGQDTIDEANSNSYKNVIDKIVFTDINKQDIIFTKENSNDITLKVKDSEDKITIKNAHSSDWIVEEIHFADGEVMTYEELMSKPFEYYGDEKDNTITGYSQKAYIKAGAGNDTINTSSLNDEIYGQDGDDKIYAGSGEDLLVGGKGNDRLEGSYGADTYIFSEGDGVDIIYDYDSNTQNKDIIKIGYDILNTTFKRDGSNLTIGFTDSDDSITINNWYSGSSYQIEEIQSSDNHTITNIQLQLMIDAMASYTKDKGIDWNTAIKQNPNEIQNILQNFWVAKTN